MASSPLRNDLDLMEEAWQNFSFLIFEEIKKLEDEQEKCEIKIKNIESLVKSFENCKKDRTFVLRHKNIF